MPTTLRVLRHAKAGWGDPTQPDKQRPLNDRGRHDAQRMARWLSEHTARPRQLVVSTALRTRQSAEPIIDAMGLNAEQVAYEEDLYLADPLDMLKVAARHGTDHVLLLGHNPGCHDLVMSLVCRQDRVRIDQYPTCTYSEIHFDGDVAPAVGELLHYVGPADLDGEI